MRMIKCYWQSVDNKMRMMKCEWQNEYRKLRVTKSVEEEINSSRNGSKAKLSTVKP